LAASSAGAGAGTRGLPTSFRNQASNAAADSERAAPDTPWGETGCAAVNRYLNAPMKRHHGLRLAAQALDFVAGES